MKLTKHEENIYNSIIKFINEKGYSPSIREIAKINYTSTSYIQNTIYKLEFLGYIKRTEKICRSIIIK